MHAWKINFLLGWPIFRGYVSFREGILRIPIDVWTILVSGKYMFLNAPSYPLAVFFGPQKFARCAFQWFFRKTLQIRTLQNSALIYQNWIRAGAFACAVSRSCSFFFPLVFDQMFGDGFRLKVILDCQGAQIGPNMNEKWGRIVREAMLHQHQARGH